MTYTNQLFGNNIGTTINASFTSAAPTTLSVLDTTSIKDATGARLPSSTDGTTFMLLTLDNYAGNVEIVRAVACSSTTGTGTLTIDGAGRGLEGTTAMSYTYPGTSPLYVEGRVTGGSLESFRTTTEVASQISAALSGYATLAGSSTQTFSVANGTTTYQAINYGQYLTLNSTVSGLSSALTSLSSTVTSLTTTLPSTYAAIGGNSSHQFLVNTATSSNQAVNLGQMQGNTVADLNGYTGAVSLTAGTHISLTYPGSNTIQVNNAGVTSLNSTTGDMTLTSALFNVATVGSNISLNGVIGMPIPYTDSTASTSAHYLTALNTVAAQAQFIVILAYEQVTPYRTQLDVMMITGDDNIAIVPDWAFYNIHSVCTGTTTPGGTLCTYSSSDYPPNFSIQVTPNTSHLIDYFYTVITY